MSSSDDLRDLRLDLAARQALALIEERVTASLSRALAAVRPADKLWAVALQYSDQQEFEPAAVFWSTLSDRQVALQRKLVGDPNDFFDPVWDLHRWGEGAHLDPWPSDAADFVAANEVLADALEEADVANPVNPVRWVLARIARRATHQAQPVPVADDFVVVPVDPSDYEEITDNLAFIVSAETLESFRRAYLLPYIEPPRDDRVAYLHEISDDDLTHYLALFECGIGDSDDDVPDEDGPMQVPLHEALAWATENATRIRLEVGDGCEFSAGALPIEGLPTWPSNRQLARRRMN